MPIYDYVCASCRNRIEVIHRIDAEGPRFCPACGAEGTMRKAVATPAVHFKGSGWAKKDRSSASRARSRSSSDSSPSGESSSGGAGSDGGSTSDSSSGGSSSDSSGGEAASGSKAKGDRTSTSEGKPPGDSSGTARDRTDARKRADKSSRSSED